MASEAVRDNVCGGGVEDPVVDDEDDDGDEANDLESGERGSVHKEEELECSVSSKWA